MIILLATSNQHKVNEIENMINEIAKEINFVDSINVQPFFDHIPDGIESFNTYHENALAKAKYVFNRFLSDRPEIFNYDNVIVLAEDSGLEVDFLHGFPGVKSKRFLNLQEEDIDKIEKYLNNAILEKLNHIDWFARTAKMKSTFVALYTNGEYDIAKGTIQGYITREPRGIYGWAYDKIFEVDIHDPLISKLMNTDEYYRDVFMNHPTLAEIPPEIKNKISHRYRSLFNTMTLLKKKILMEGRKNDAEKI